jgi:hypothetical protein
VYSTGVSVSAAAACKSSKRVVAALAGDYDRFMAITFLCPNGHKLNCKEKLAGRPGVCPKCSAPFVVPQPQREPAQNEISDSAGPWEFTQQELAAAGSPRGAAKPPSRAAAPPTGEPIVFLCPNGHRLHSSPDTVGRPGQCPHCQARFLIPSPDDLIDDEAGEAAGTEVPSASFGVEAAVAPAEPRPDAAPEPRLARAHEVPAAAAPGDMASTFRQLWALKTQQSAVIELHLGDNKILVPESFANSWSSETHAVFADREANGAYRLTAVAWSSISRVVLRGLKSLPPGITG